MADEAVAFGRGPQQVPSFAGARTLARFPAPGLFVLAAISQYLGAAAAVTLFNRLPAGSVAWLRVLTAALVLVAWHRPWRGMWTARRLLLVGAFGTALACMNLLFYLAIDRVPLGNAVAVEFLGPVSVAALGSRRARDVAALALAAAGVLLVSGASVAGGETLGIAAALGAAGCWALYILLGARVARAGEGVRSLAAGMLIGALVIAPVTTGGAGPAFSDPVLLLACVGVGMLSSTIPYVLDQLALLRLTTAQFALLQCLLPATAAVTGIALLHQVPSVAEAAGIALVVAAVAVRSRTTGRG